MGFFNFSSKPKPAVSGPLSAVLAERGYVYQHSAPVEEITDGPKRTLYLGIDPTSDSMHVGHLQAMIVLRRFIEHEHKVIVLMGGGTGMIGDPSGKSEERVLLDEATLKHNAAGIGRQAKNIFRSGNFVMRDNLSWLGALNLIEFLRDVGKNFSVNAMIQRDSVKERLEGREQGISYTEFSYMLLQAYDFLHLFEKEGCTLQLGASDQWGNMVSGVDLIRRKTGESAYALSFPLLVNKSTGKKFGKSEGGAVWLDAAKTSPFDFYQFWFNTADADVEEYLLKMTMLAKSEIDAVMEEQRANPGARPAQKLLAAEVTELVHGIREVAAPALRAAGKKLRDVAGELGLSMSELRRLVEQKGVTLNDTTLPTVDDTLSAGTLKIGKQRFYEIK